MRVWPIALSVGVLLSSLVPIPSPAAEKVVSDRESGCRIRDQNPDARKAIRWTGPCRNGFAHGAGVLEWTLNGRPDGWIEGTFVDGRLDGKVRVEWEDGRTFTGTYEHGRASGHGTMTYPNGHRYVGSFERDRPTGDGEFISSTGIRYTARIDGNGGVWPGAMLGPDAPVSARSAQRPSALAKLVPRDKVASVVQRAEKRAPRPMKPVPNPQLPEAVQSEEDPPRSGEAAPGSLEEWLRQPSPVATPGADLRPTADY